MVGLRLLAIVVAAVLIPAAAANAACSGLNVVAAPEPAAVAKTVACLINAERERHGLKPLGGHERLRKAANKHAADMAKHTYFSHTGRDGSSPKQRARRVGYRRKFLREAIGWGGGTSATPLEQLQRWMSSSLHRSYILHKRAKVMGVAVSNGSPFGGPGITYTVLFGR